jgi:S-adenosylmethionine hydrolase
MAAAWVHRPTEGQPAAMPGRKKEMRGPQNGLAHDASILTMRPDFSSGAAAVAGKIEGTVVAYGPTGNLVTDIPNDRLQSAPRGGSAQGDSVKILCDEHETVGIYPANHPEQPATLLAVLGASGFLELTIVGDSAQVMLGVPLKEKVVVKW